MKSIFLSIIFISSSLFPNQFDEFLNSQHTKNELNLMKIYVSELDYQKTIDEINKVRKTYDYYSDYIEEKNYFFHESNHLDHYDSIPKILHFIWIGSKPFPEKSMKRLKRWSQLHPEFKIYFWTDLNRVWDPSYESLVSFKKINDFFNENKKKYEKIVNFYFSSVNYEEKSDLLRYMLLDSIGGIYINHDVEPLRSVTPLVSNFSFFCCCENIGPMVDASYLRFTNDFIGAKKNSRIINKTLEKIIENWDENTNLINKLNSLSYSVNNILGDILIICRTFLPFTHAVNSIELNRSEIIFPAQFFSQKFYQELNSTSFTLVDHHFNGSLQWVHNQKSNPKSKNEIILKKVHSRLIRLFNLSFILFFFVLLSIFFQKKIQKTKIF